MIDFDYYALYRSNNPENFPSEPLIILTETTYTDTQIPTDTVYYVLSAFDYNENESSLSNVVSIEPGKLLDLKVFLEGPFYYVQMIPYLNMAGYLPLSQPYNTAPWNYSGIESVSSIPNYNIVDWVLLEFRDATSAEEATSYDNNCYPGSLFKK